MRNTLRPANNDVSAKRLHNFCISKNKMVIIREDKRERYYKEILKDLLLKDQEKGYGSKKLLAEFPNKAFELIPTVFIGLETCVFTSVLVLGDK